MDLTLKINVALQWTVVVATGNKVLVKILTNPLGTISDITLSTYMKTTSTFSCLPFWRSRPILYFIRSSSTHAQGPSNEPRRAGCAISIDRRINDLDAAR